MRKPLMTKNIATPNSPCRKGRRKVSALRLLVWTCSKITDSTDRARSPSSEGIERSPLVPAAPPNFNILAHYSLDFAPCKSAETYRIMRAGANRHPADFRHPLKSLDFIAHWIIQTSSCRRIFLRTQTRETGGYTMPQGRGNGNYPEYRRTTRRPVAKAWS